MSSELLQHLPLGTLGDASAHEPAWLSHLRSEAAERLRSEGMPTKKTEEWRFTNVRPLLDLAFEPAGRSAGSEQIQARAEAHLGRDESLRIYVINGRPVGFPKPPAGVELLRLAQVLGDEPESIQPHLARYARSRFFGAINSALFEDGVVLRVERGAQVQTPIQLVFITTENAVPTVVYPRTLVLAQKASSLSLVETYLHLQGGAAQTLTTAVTEVALEAGARVEHLRIVEGGTNSYHVGALGVDQGRDSQYTSRSVALGGSLSRVDIDVRMRERGAGCRLDGVYHAGKAELVDHHTRIVHDAAHCSSSEEYKGLIDGTGHAIFDGTIVVKRDAQQTSAHQQNHNLLLSDDAVVNTKPHLEIDADDVSCSHGATVGALDEDQLFYLRARGIGKEQAEAMLTFSFVRSLLDRIEHSAIRKRLLSRVVDRLPHGHEIRELSQ